MHVRWLKEKADVKAEVKEEVKLMIETLLSVRWVTVRVRVNVNVPPCEFRPLSSTIIFILKYLHRWLQVRLNMD